MRVAAMTDVPSAELLARYRQHDPAAAEELFRRYAERLTRLARSRLARKLAARIDPEDVILSAYRSFFLLARGGGVALRESGDLWRLLVRITLRKVYRSARRHYAECRSVEREQPLSGESGAALEAAALGREPTPGEAAALLDELRCLLAPLGPVQRRIVELRLQGHEVDEIATEVRRSPRTVRRTLAGLGEELERRLRKAALPPTGPPPVAGAVAWLSYGDIVLQRQLGEGGMGKVYRARRRGSSVPVAVKLLRKPLRQHETATARLLAEAELLARLGHSGIVAIHALGRLPDGGHFLVMDLIEGSDLAREMAAGPVPLGKALRWVSEAADAIHHAHERGVVHCDLKPSNLLLDRSGRVHVTDFGLGRMLGDGNGQAAGGTAGYMAPEQADPAWGPISPRTDVHGLGAVLYALLGGHPPFAADSPSGLPARTAWPAAPPGLAALRPDVPASVAALCGRCLVPEPEHRPGSATALAAALRELERDLCPR
jgi:eukaryotic-like serine/threonine-protein kinase